MPPSRFQRREGSIYSTPSSRDGHVKGAARDKAYFDKLKEKVSDSGSLVAVRGETNGKIGLDHHPISGDGLRKVLMRVVAVIGGGSCDMICY